MSLTVASACDDFLDDIRAKKREHTWRTYRTAINIFREFLDAQGVKPSQSAGALSVDRGMAFPGWLVNSHFGGNANTRTVNTYLAAVRKFFHYLFLRHNLIEPVDHARLCEEYRDFSSVKRRIPLSVADEDIQAIIAAARSVPPQGGETLSEKRREMRRLRDIALVECLRSTGARIGELLNLRLQDLDRNRHRALVRAEHTKGYTERFIYFDFAAWAALHEYHRYRDKVLGTPSGRAVAFARHSRNAGMKAVLPLSAISADRIMLRLSKAAGLAEQNVTPKDFRHWFATRLNRATGNLAVVQDALGHQSPETTRIYVRVEERQIKDAHKKAFGY